MKSKEIDRYISGYPEQVQQIMEEVRETIHKAAPQAEEAFKWAMPTFVQEGNLVHFAGHRNHLGFYPGPEAIRVFGKELNSYRTSKGAIQFPYDLPVPHDLVSRIVAFRVQENLSRKK